MIAKAKAIFALYPNVVNVIDDKDAYDINGNLVEINIEDVELKALELKQLVENEIQSKLDAKQSALNKLMALGLTEEEALALGNRE